MLAVLGAATEEGITVRDASELRVKETDRIRTVVDNLRRMGVEAEELPDGMVVPGRQKFHAAELDSFRRSPHCDGVRGGGAGRRRRIGHPGSGSGIGLVPGVLGNAGKNHFTVISAPTMASRPGIGTPRIS